VRFAPKALRMAIIVGGILRAALRANLTRRDEPPNASMRSAPSKSHVRSGTRISCEIRISLTSLDLAHSCSEPCLTVLVNPQGCAARFGRPLEVGAAVRLEGLPTGTNVTARVVNCIPVGEYGKFWLLGLALDEPGNVWGVQTPPKDWGC
jgi:hypothetical protein